MLIEPVPMPEPAMTYAIEPKSRADEDKLAPALHKLMEEDLELRFYRDPQTNEFLVAGAGQLHIEAVVSRLKRRLSHGGHAEGAEDSLSRDDSRQCRGAWAAQEADGRTWAVWRLQDSH